MRFHYEYEGQRRGPCTVGQLRNMADFGGLSLETRVSEEGNERWISLGSLLHSQSVAVTAQPPSAKPAPQRAPQPRPIVRERSLSGRKQRAPSAFGRPAGGAPRVSPTSSGAKSRAVYVLLAVSMGPVGVHNFYAGYKGRGIAQLLITLFMSWLIIPLAMVFFWVLVEIFTVEKDATGVPFS